MCWFVVCMCVCCVYVCLLCVCVFVVCMCVCCVYVCLLGVCVRICVCLDHQLATAPTNGSVVLWNIEKRTKSKLGEF